MADVSIDASVSTATARGMRSVVFTSPNVGYWFYIDGGGTFVYSKTSDGGASWGAAVTIATATTHLAFDVWFDKWTPGDNGTLIHTTYFDTTNDAVRWRSLDTGNSDTLGTERTVFAGASATTTSARPFCSVTKTRSGYIYVAYDIDAGAEKGLHRSTDSGTSWSASLASTFVEATLDWCSLFPASGTGDNNDCWSLYDDVSADALTLKMWDSSAAAQVESASIATLVENTTDLVGQYGWSGSVRHSDGHLIVALIDAYDSAGASNHMVFDIADTSTITAKTAIQSSTDDHYYPQVFIDQETDQIYVAYNGLRDGSEVIGTTTKVYYTKSTDGGASWTSGNTAYMANAAAVVVQVWAPLMGSRFYVGWRIGTTLLGASAAAISLPKLPVITEAGSATDTPSNIATFAAAITEAGSAVDSPVGGYLVAQSEAASAADSPAGGYLVAQSEAATASDSPAGGYLVAQSEAGTAADSPSAGTTQPTSITEAGSATDNPVGGYLVAQSEAATAADSPDAGLLLPVVQTEAATATDSPAGGYLVAQSEAATGADSPSATQLHAAAITETGSATDAPAGGYAVAQAEAISAGDTPSAALLQPAEISESALAGEAPGATLTQPAAISDAAAAGDSPGALKDLAASITEAGSASETPAAAVTQPASISEAGSAGDSPEALLTQTAAITEVASASDQQSRSAWVAGAITEALAGSDSAGAALLTPASLVESGNAIDVMNGEVESAGASPAAIIETAVAIDACDGAVTWAVAAAEGGNAVDVASGAAIVDALISEFIGAVDWADAELAPVVGRGERMKVSARETVLVGARRTIGNTSASGTVDAGARRAVTPGEREKVQSG